MSDELLTISEMCDEFSVTPRTLRYYEYIELLAPRRDGRKRLYAARDRGRLKLILRGRRYGFSLEQIRQYLELYNLDEDQVIQTQAWIKGAGKRLTELEAERRVLDETIADLRRSREDAMASLETKVSETS